MGKVTNIMRHMRHTLRFVMLEGTPSYTESTAYDVSSNPVPISRHGITKVPTSTAVGTLRFGLCDDITLKYSDGRLVRADDAAAHVAQENHYYPGGMLFGESTSFCFTRSSPVNAYRYGGKEFLTHGGLYLSLHGARMYAPALLRLLTNTPYK